MYVRITLKFGICQPQLHGLSCRKWDKQPLRVMWLANKLEQAQAKAEGKEYRVPQTWSYSSTCTTCASALPPFVSSGRHNLVNGRLHSAIIGLYTLSSVFSKLCLHAFWHLANVYKQGKHSSILHMSTKVDVQSHTFASYVVFWSHLQYILLQGYLLDYCILWCLRAHTL